MPSMLQQAGVYSGVHHYRQAVQACGSTDAATVVAEMRAMPMDDMYNDVVAIRPDGRVLHESMLVRLRSPSPSRYPNDVYDIVAGVPGTEAFRPMG